MNPRDPEIERAATTEGVPVAPSAADAIQSARIPLERTLIDARIVLLCVWSVGVAIVTGFVAQALMAIIGLITNISFYGRFSFAFSSPANNHLGWLVLVIPAIGGVIVGYMARYGSTGIRGHGIPEAMEQVLLNESRIPARLTFLKPLSAAIAIGTGGPFGAEGPIIATGGALGSLLGQIFKTTPAERKTLLAAGAAAGMAATFGSPVSAVLLAIELLLFEFRPRSIVPVALASVAATAVRMFFAGTAPIFAMPVPAHAGGTALAIYTLVGAVVGWLSVYVTRAVYWAEDFFEHLPVHWMWWPAIGGLVVGAVGIVAPHTLGVGYDNIEALVGGHLVGRAVLWLCIFKFVSWAISLGSGTSGGTLAPLFTIGGACGVVLGELLAQAAPSLGIDPRICGLVGMAAMFAGASRALLASVVFAFETTLQPLGLLPLLGGCTAGYLVSALLMRNTIMTEKLARRGVRVPAEYAADFLDRIHVGEACSHNVVALREDQTVEDVADITATHQGFPVVDASGKVVGVVTRRDFAGVPGETKLRQLVRRPPTVVYTDMTLRDAADHMIRENIGRLPVVDRSSPPRLVGILTRSDLLKAQVQRIEEER
ncbi:MAG TPA: chloride channel protein [Thermoanaerobaculia bacterium]|nr:chloride channel protein [Thermoanaerobaculia bacterium]